MLLAFAAGPMGLLVSGVGAGCGFNDDRCLVPFDCAICRTQSAARAVAEGISRHVAVGLIDSVPTFGSQHYPSRPVFPASRRTGHGD
jgi:hypothetical protein